MYARLAIIICAVFSATWSYAQPDEDASEKDSVREPRRGWAALRGPERIYVEGRDDPSFMFCTIQYSSNGVYEPLGLGWGTDYPGAGFNLMNAIAEKTSIEIAQDENGEPVRRRHGARRGP